MARQKTERESEIALAHKVCKLNRLMLRGNEQERETARRSLEQLLTKNRRSSGDVDRLIALSFSNPERTRHDDNDDQDEPLLLPTAGKAPDVFALVDWMLRRFLFLECHQYTALALWILHSFVFREFQHTPRLAVLSPVRGCGKSVALKLCASLCLRAHKLGSVTTAGLARLIDRNKPTVLLDEADNLDFANDPVLRAILNDGFERGGIRVCVVNSEPREFDLFAPLAFGAIGRLPLPLMSRSIVINMSRASPETKPLERFDLKNPVLLAELNVIYREAFAWAQQVRTRLDTDPLMPDRFYGRAADRWRVLFSIADALGRGDQARQAAKVFATEHTDEDVKIVLLADIRRVFGAFADDQIGSEVLLQHLLMLDDNCWTEFRGEHGNQPPRPLSRHAMATMLSAFGLRSKTLWPPHRSADTKSFRGYTKAAFQPLWGSYCDHGDTATQSSVVRHLRRP
ncbi:MAG: DUF3631 domain-containing protein [Bradyrhizobium sp.]|uniref:DUF3631 domain-containing protein n=1 Tax=Bradyrhizobium sp. TaxID=376 RepID=UPI00120486CD|nr:DUF3631 domain-containing protein [Bradyrhizobium sp.]THD61111.1 MAG: DUF3631 domain-containing protein [Bradyrhizobium sp.]